MSPLNSAIAAPLGSVMTAYRPMFGMSAGSPITLPPSFPARCALASQQQLVVGSLLRLDPQLLRVRHGAPDGVADVEPPLAPMLIAELLDIDDGAAIVDARFAAKQPDWTFDAEDSGQSPVERLTDRRAAESVEG